MHGLSDIVLFSKLKERLIKVATSIVFEGVTSIHKYSDERNSYYTNYNIQLYFPFHKLK